MYYRKNNAEHIKVQRCLIIKLNEYAVFKMICDNIC